jgi:penicillin-binding protein 2
LIKLQVVDKEKYYRLSTKNMIYRTKLKAKRGLIIDRNGKLIVGNRIGYNLYVIDGLNSDKINEVKNELKKINITWNEKKYKRNQENLVKRYLSYKDYLYISANETKFRYLDTKEVLLRDYYYRETFFHPVGYASLITPKYLRNKEYEQYDENDYIGKKGLEKRYEKELKGNDGINVLIKDTYGHKMELTLNNVGNPSLYKKLKSNKIEPKSGKNLQLTLDKELQTFIYDLLKDYSATSIVMNIKTGEVLAFVSTPGTDPNLFLKGISSEIWSNIVSDERHSLLNKGLELFSPASTFKPFTAYCGIKEGLIKNDSKFKPCRGVIKMYGIKKHCWKKGGHGREDISGAIRDSCNIYFFQLGDKLGINTFHKYAELLALNKKTGIEIYNEKQSVIPDKNYKFANRIADGRWYPPETLDVSIGQGFVQMTPIKLLQFYSFIGSKGKLVQPYIIKKIDDKELIYPVKIIEHDTSVFAPIIKGLHDVVDWGGTGWRANSKLIKICGKTGTMQVKKITKYFKKLSPEQDEIPYKERDTGLFASFAPYKSPEYAAVVVIEHHGSGGYLPAMITKKIYEFMKKGNYFEK